MQNEDYTPFQKWVMSRSHFNIPILEEYTLSEFEEETGINICMDDEDEC